MSSTTIFDGGKAAVVAASNVQCPFPIQHQLSNELDDSQTDKLRPVQDHLPGHPRIRLDIKEELLNFLETEFRSQDLERLAPRLWWMSKQDSASISPLHRQRVKKRSLVITEDPKLHLVWIHDRIFLKPLPEYLLSHAFWQRYLLIGDNNNPDDYSDDERTGRRLQSIRRAALGYLRTYFYLIRHESDFRMAQEAVVCLVPARITWKQFCDFSRDFKSIPDHEVSQRYTYGEIRLTRLNFYTKILLHKWYFQRVETQYSAYFAQFYAPFLFVFGILSIILSAMQVEAAIEQIDSAVAWAAFYNTSRIFGVAVLISVAGLITALVLLLVYRVVMEWRYALREHFGREKGRLVSFPSPEGRYGGV